MFSCKNVTLNSFQGLVVSESLTSTLPTSLKGRSKVAFTLAEVLITLGIIGVVAALTLPTLIAKYQEQVLITQGKKVLSIINNAYQQTLYDYGISGFNQYNKTPEETEAFTKAFLTKLNVVESHENEPLLQNGLIPNYTPLSTALANPDEKYFEETRDQYGKEGEEFNLQDFIARNYYGYNVISSWKYGYYLNDGTLIIFYPYTQPIINNLLVDTNGQKGPNRWGYDVLAVSCLLNKPKCTYMNASEKGGVVRKITGLE